jgi:hypothetical protein
MFVGKYGEWRPLERLWSRWQNVTKTDFREIFYEEVNRIELA